MKSALEHLEELIRIPSVSHLSNRPLIEYARSSLEEGGWVCREVAYRGLDGVEKVNLIAAPTGFSPFRADCDLAIMCHTDTVPYASNWADATTPRVVSDAVHGCGACDVKGFLAALLSAAFVCQDARVSMDLRIVLTADEEIGCLGAKHLRAEEALAPKALVIGEPTSLRPARAGKGYCLAAVSVIGKEAHSAHPARGASAILAAANFVGRLEEYAGELTDRTNLLFDPPYTTVNIGKIEGGSAKNIIPGTCNFLVEWRPVPGQSATEVLQTLRCMAEEVCSKRPDVQFRINAERQHDGFETQAESHLVRILEKLSGQESTCISFSSEACVFADLPNVVVFGPGDMKSAHSERERIDVQELVEADRILRALMLTGI